MKTNAPVEFSYIPATIDGKGVGIVLIARQQQRPLFLKKRFGKLEANQVYLRRGSSTEIALPDEIARMGKAEAAMALRPTLLIQLGDPISRKLHGETASVYSRILTEPPQIRSVRQQIDDGYSRFEQPFGLRLGPAQEQLDEYERRCALISGLAFVVHNTGSVLIEDLRLVVNIPKGDELTLTDEFPEEPRGPLEIMHIPTFAPSALSTHVQDTGESWELVACLGKVQPNATVWSHAFWIGSSAARDVPLVTRVYADNIAEKTEIALSVRVDVKSGFLRRRRAPT